MPELNQEWIEQATKAELMALARDSGLSIEGKKYQVRNRLLDLLESQQDEEPDEDTEEVEFEPDNPNWPTPESMSEYLDDLVGSNSLSETDIEEVATTDDDTTDIIILNEEEEPVAVAQVVHPKEISPEFAEERIKKMRAGPTFYDDGVLELYQWRLGEATSEEDKARITKQIAWLKEHGKFEFPPEPEPEETEDELEEPEAEEEHEEAEQEAEEDSSEPELTDEFFENATKSELVEACVERGLARSGTKAKLIKRLKGGD